MVREHLVDYERSEIIYLVTRNTQTMCETEVVPGLLRLRPRKDAVIIF